MVAGDGFEPTTFGLWAQRATKLLYPAILTFKQFMAEKEGFEPPRRRRPPGFQDRSLQPDLGISPKSLDNEMIISYKINKSQYLFKKYYT